MTAKVGVSGDGIKSASAHGEFGCRVLGRGMALR